MMEERPEGEATGDTAASGEGRGASGDDAPAPAQSYRPEPAAAPETSETPETPAASPASGEDAPMSRNTPSGGYPMPSRDGGGPGYDNNRNNDRNNDRNSGGYNQDRRNGRRHRRGRGRGRSGAGGQGGQGGQVTQSERRPEHQQQQQQQQAPIVATAEARGWFDSARDGGFIRRANNSYLAEQGDAYVPPAVVRQFGLRRADLVDASVGFDQRGRATVVEIKSINEADPAAAVKRPEFNALTASYPERKLYLETGRPAKGGVELIRRAIDLIAPIGYGQRALIVAPSRAGKTTLLHAVTEGVALNHPKAALLILLVDERPEEVTEAISWGVGEVVSSSFDQPAQRHVDVTEMVLARAHRLVELGKDVVIVLDSLTRMGRAHNTAERGTGRTLSGGLDATAMAKPKAFFGSARAIPESSGGGSLTIVATALVETGSRMDDVIFEEFKGTGNCEIKLDRGLAEKRIYPAIDITTSGTRREEKLFRPDQIDAVYTLRRGLAQMPPQSAMEWLIKRIAATPSNDALLSGL
jgi:transcription termination factor Rho